MEKTYNVTGMTCAACQANVTKAVAKLEGVDNVDVSLLGNSMKVDFNDDVLNDADICSAVEKIGYGASPKDQSVTNEKSSMKAEWDARQERIEKESAASKRRLVWSVVIMIPLMYVAMGDMLHLPMPSILTGMENHMINALVQIIMATIIMIIQKHFYVDGFKGLIHRAPNMDSLVAMGSTAAYVYGVGMMFIMAYGYGHGNMEMVHSAAHSLYFDSAAMIVTLVSIGKFLESRSKAKTGDALGKLMDLTPKNSIVLRDGQEVQIASEDIVVGDIVVMKPGSRVPVDGTIVSGTGYLDQSAITGESIPVEKQEGDSVISATMNENGNFQFRAEKVGDDTTLAQIIRLVDEAGTSKAPIARIADKVAGVFVPTVIGIALVTFIGWMVFAGDFQTALNNSISVLVISCPCALGLATPMAIMVGTEKAAQYGILLKNAQSLENLHKIDTVVLDKTGTITSGEPVVQDVYNYSSMSDSQFVSLAASLEKGSQHPLALAIVDYAKDMDIQDVSNFQNHSGYGIQADLDQTYYAGNVKWMKKNGLKISNQIQSDLDTLAKQGKTPMLFGSKTEILGIIAVADAIRETSTQAIGALQSKGIHVVMLTGDNAQTAQAIATEVGVDEVISDVLPADKEAHVRKYQEQGKFVAMVGDGINDAPALVRADIGLAIGQGTDIAMDSADVVLMKNSLLDVNTAIELSAATIRNVKQNLFWAFIYNVIGIPLAMGLIAGLTMSPMYGAAAMSFSSVFVCTNAWRLRFFKPKEITSFEKHVPQLHETIQEPEGETTVLNVSGMMCEHCVKRVQGALEKVDGVQNVDVNLEAGTATVVGNAEQGALEQAVVDAGYEISKPTVLNVSGMMCEHCVARVKGALEKVDGVQNVDVNLEQGTATVVGNAELDVLEQAVVDAGYEIVKEKENKTMKKVMKVEGMMCQNCQAHVKKAIEGVEGVSNVVVDLENGLANYEANESVEDATVSAAVKEAGYTPVSVENA